MTIQECYKEMGGDFEGVQKRFGGGGAGGKICHQVSERFQLSGSGGWIKRKGCGESIPRGTYPERNLSEPGL